MILTLVIRNQPKRVLYSHFIGKPHLLKPEEGIKAVRAAQPILIFLFIKEFPSDGNKVVSD